MAFFPPTQKVRSGSASRDGAVGSESAAPMNRRGILSPLLLVLSTCFGPDADPEVHLIPAGYSGDIFIIHNVPAGEPVLREGGARVYRIPVNGILTSNDDSNIGSGPLPKYYYLSTDGRREPIEGFWAGTVKDTRANRADPTVGIYFPHHGSINRPELTCWVEYDQYFVGTKGQLCSHTTPGAQQHASRHSFPPTECVHEVTRNSRPLSA